VNTALDPAPAPSSRPQPSPADGERGLAALLELFESGEAGTTSARRSLRPSAAPQFGWTQDSSRRAARWGAVAGAPQ
jgi:hypothetical protein